MSTRYRSIDGDKGYRVGSDGTVWSCLVKISLGNKGSKQIAGETWRQLKLLVSRDGHLYVMIRGRKRKVHQLVLEAFVGPRPPGMEARHFPDRDPTNNRVENLSWGTHQQNIHDQRVHETDNSGERNGQAKITAAEVKSLRSDAVAGITPTNLSKKYGISRTQVRRIVSGKRWTHV